MRVNAMNNTVQTLDVGVGESTSKLVNWSLANWHVSETTVIRVRSRANTIKGQGKGHSYLTSVVPSVPTRLLSMEADGAPSTPPSCHCQCSVLRMLQKLIQWNHEILFGWQGYPADSQVPKQHTLNRKSLKTAESLISAKDKSASKINAHARGPRVACLYFARSLISPRSWKLFTVYLVCENAEEIWIRRLSKTLPFNKVRLWTHQYIAEILKLHFLRNTAAVSSLFSKSVMPG